MSLSNSKKAIYENLTPKQILSLLFHISSSRQNKIINVSILKDKIINVLISEMINMVAFTL